jgi:hypothetical protein
MLADFVHSRQRIVPRRALDAGFAFTHPSPLERVRSVLTRADTQPARAGAPALDAALEKP